MASSIPVRVRAVRESQVPHLTQKEMAARLGIPATTYSRYESGERDPSAAALAALVSAFPEVDARWLLTGQGEMHEPGARFSPEHEKQLVDLGKDVSAVLAKRGAMLDDLAVPGLIEQVAAIYGEYLSTPGAGVVYGTLLLGAKFSEFAQAALRQQAAASRNALADFARDPASFMHRARDLFFGPEPPDTKLPDKED